MSGQYAKKSVEDLSERQYHYAEAVNWRLFSEGRKRFRLTAVTFFALILAIFGLFLDSPSHLLGKGIDDLDVHVGRTVLIAKSRRYCWFPSILQFPNGEIMAAMSTSPDERNPEGRYSASCFSKDGGRTWSRRYTMLGIARRGAFTAAPLANGKILNLDGTLDPYPPGQARQFRGSLTKLSDGGIRLEKIRDVVVRLSQPVVMSSIKLYDGRSEWAPDDEKSLAGLPWGLIIPALNSDLLVPFYYTAVPYPKYYRSVLLRSADDGKTWREYSTMASVQPNGKPWPGMGREGPCEPGLVRLADGRLYTIFRTGSDGYMGQAWSSNDGKTWTAPTSTLYKGVDPHVRRLSDGVLACTYGRPGPVTIMFSVDGTGKHWSHITTIFSGKSTHYTDFIEVKPGKLLVVYDSVPYGWKPIPTDDTTSWNAIYGTFIDVKKK